MKKISIIVILIILLTGCSSPKKELETILESNNYIIVDVRTNDEYLSGHIKNAINIPYDEINSNSGLDDNKTILVYCKSGTRSAIAATTLKDLGYKVYDLGAYESIDLEKE